MDLGHGIFFQEKRPPMPDFAILTNTRTAHPYHLTDQRVWFVYKQNRRLTTPHYDPILENRDAIGLKFITKYK